MPESSARLPSDPNGVSALAANRLAPTGSARTGSISDGMIQGRLSSRQVTATTPSRRARSPDRPPRASAAGAAARPEITIPTNPPTAAGSSASASRAGAILAGPAHSTRSTQGSPAYPRSNAHWPITSRSARYGFQL